MSLLLLKQQVGGAGPLLLLCTPHFFLLFSRASPPSCPKQTSWPCQARGHADVPVALSAGMTGRSLEWVGGRFLEPLKGAVLRLMNKCGALFPISHYGPLFSLSFPLSLQGVGRLSLCFLPLSWGRWESDTPAGQMSDPSALRGQSTETSHALLTCTVRAWHPAGC